MVESFILTPSLINSVMQNPRIGQTFSPFIVLKRTLELAGKSSCNCAGARGNAAKRTNEAYNQCKMAIANMAKDKLTELKALMDVRSLEISYTDNRGVNQHVTV